MLIYLCLNRTYKQTIISTTVATLDQLDAALLRLYHKYLLYFYKKLSQTARVHGGERYTRLAYFIHCLLLFTCVQLVLKKAVAFVKYLFFLSFLIKYMERFILVQSICLSNYTLFI